MRALRHEQALAEAATLRQRCPCTRVHMLVHLASALNERRLPLPPWRAPATSWALLVSAPDCLIALQGDLSDDAWLDAVNPAWFYSVPPGWEQDPPQTMQPCDTCGLWEGADDAEDSDDLEWGRA